LSRVPQRRGEKKKDCNCDICGGERFMGREGKRFQRSPMCKTPLEGEGKGVSVTVPFEKRGCSAWGREDGCQLPGKGEDHNIFPSRGRV